MSEQVGERIKFSRILRNGISAAQSHFVIFKIFWGLRLKLQKSQMELHTYSTYIERDDQDIAENFVREMRVFKYF